MGKVPAQEDLPPELDWETPVWMLTMQLHSQVRVVPMGGIIGYDLNVFLPIIAHKGWHPDIALELITAIEAELFSKEKNGE